VMQVRSNRCCTGRLALARRRSGRAYNKLHAQVRSDGGPLRSGFVVLASPQSQTAQSQVLPTPDLISFRVVFGVGDVGISEAPSLAARSSRVRQCWEFWPASLNRVHEYSW
jgi:hypothetical protein